MSGILGAKLHIVQDDSRLIVEERLVKVGVLELGYSRNKNIFILEVFLQDKSVLNTVTIVKQIIKICKVILKGSWQTTPSF